MPPPLSATATATRLAAHWAVDALAGDEALDFSILKTLVSSLPECLTGAPKATRERVALRCLQEVAPVASSAGDAAATAGVLRFEPARSCEDLLLELIGEVGRSGTVDKDMLPPFSQDIQNIICMKKSTLPETSFELLGKVDPEIASMVPPSQLQQNGSNEHDNDQFLCSNRDHVNKDNAEFQQETTSNLVDETESRNLEKDPIAPTFVLHQPCTSDSKSYDHLRDDDAGAVGLGARPQDPEARLAVDKIVPLETVHASVGCDATLQGSTTAPFSKDREVHAAMVQPQSPKEPCPNAPPHYIDEERLHDGPRDQSLKPSNEGQGTDAAEAPSLDSSSDALPTNASEPGQLPESVTAEDTTMISQPHSSKTDTNVLQHESVDKVNQVVDDVSASIQPVEKNHVHELTVQSASALPSVSCNDAIQGGQSDTNHPPGNTTEHTTVFEGQNGDKSRIESSGADKVNEALHDNASILEKTTVLGGLHAQATSLSQNCNSALHDKIAEADCSYEQNTGKSITDAQKNSCSTSVPNITQDGTGTNTTNTSSKRNLGDTSAGIPHVSSSYDSLHGTAAAGLPSMTNKMPSWPKDHEMNDSLEGLSQQDLCIKCGKAGELLKCSGCLLAAHDSCFGSSVTFQESDLFYCPVCFYAKATEAYQKAKKIYCEARKNLATFIGTKQAGGQHDELLTGVLPRAPNREVSDSSKRKITHQHEGADVAHRDEEPDQQRDEEPDQQRKKQKVYATGHGYPEEIITEKGSPVQNSHIAITNEHSVLKDNSINQVQGAERPQQGKNKEAGNGNLSHETRCSSQNRCGPPANQEPRADKEDGATNSHRSDDSDEIEDTSSNASGKRSSPPWRKRNYAPQKRYSNPVGPAGRRSKLRWTKEEETTLKEAMAKLAPQDNGPIPWVRILEYGRDVFHKTRLPSDLRVKWRNMVKKEGSRC